MGPGGVFAGHLPLPSAAHLCDSPGAFCSGALSSSLPTWAQKAAGERESPAASAAPTNPRHGQGQARACPKPPGPGWPGPAGTRPPLPGRACLSTSPDSYLRLVPGHHEVAGNCQQHQPQEGVEGPEGFWAGEEAHSPRISHACDVPQRAKLGWLKEDQLDRTHGPLAPPALLKLVPLRSSARGKMAASLAQPHLYKPPPIVMRVDSGLSSLTSCDVSSAQPWQRL